MRLVVIALVTLSSVAHADDDGYCDFVEGVANATADSQLYPELISQFGYINQPPYALNPDVSGLRAIGGLRWRLNALYGGLASRDHGHEDCQRHQALEQVRGETNARALAAKAKVLDDALGEANQILTGVTADLEARRTTTQEATATRLRVEELRALSADTHRQLSALPTDNRPLNTALATYQAADAQMEVDEGRERRAQGFELSLRAGVDQFLTGTTATQTGTNYFAVVELDINFGELLMGGDNARAADGRKRLLASGHDPLGVDATVDRLKSLVEVERGRAEQTAALVADLDRQMQTLANVVGEDSKKYRQTMWFDWIKAKAEHAYVAAHLAALQEVLGS